MTEKQHYYIRSFILLGFSFLLAKLLLSGDINYYIAPRFQGLTYVTLAITVILSVSSLRQALAGSADHVCECGGTHTLSSSVWKSVVIYGLFLLPLALGFFLPDKFLGSALAEKKGVNLLTGDAKALMSTKPDKKEPVEQPKTDQTNPAPSTKQPKQLSDQDIRKMFAGFGDFYTDTAVSMYKQPVIKLDDSLFLDGTTILDLFQKEFAGHKLETMGFVYRQPGFQSNEFVVARFMVSCCTADATVAGLMVRSPQAKTYANDSWVRVKGTLRLSSYNGNVTAGI